MSLFEEFYAGNRKENGYPDWQEWLEKRGIMGKCSVEGCERERYGNDVFCRRHYDRQREGVQNPNIIRSNDLRPVNLDSIAVGWLVGVLERLPRPKDGK